MVCGLLAELVHVYWKKPDRKIKEEIMIELLAPAGSSESLRAAVNAGADAVYIGGSMFGARAYADNPDQAALVDGIEFCHLHGRKLYMTVNTLLKEKELQNSLYEYLLPYYENGVDGLIVQDFGVVQFVQEHFPGLEVHASTQMTVTGAEGARLLQQQGITRVVPARELSLQEIRQIIEQTGIEVETFIHGAMCYCYSGQCLMSSMIGGRSGNRGRCAQPCRLPYTLTEGQTNQKENPYLLSMKDMCTLDLLPDLIDCGIASLKIEGRMKRPEYTAGVVSIYRKYIDLYQQKGRKNYRVQEDDRRLLMDLYNRGGFSKGYYQVHNGPEMMSMKRPNHFGTEAVLIKQAAKGKVKGIALEPLYKKDVLELASGAELTVSQDAAKGELLTFSVGKESVRPGAVWHRTKSEWLLQSLTDQFLKENVKEKIKGDLRIYANRPAILKIKYGEIDIEVSAELAEPAQNNPTPLASIEKQMKKTGNTPFVFERLNVELDEGLFVSVRQLNELRRRGLEALQEAILNVSRKTAADVQTEQDCSSLSGLPETGESGIKSEDSEQQDRGNESSSLQMNILVTDREQLKTVLEYAPPMTDTVYLDSMVFAGVNSDSKRGSSQAGQQDCGRQIADQIEKLHSRSIRCFFSFPPVLRQKERSLMKQLESDGVLDQFDGFLLHTIDELSWAKDYIERKKTADQSVLPILAADDNFYTYNRTAAQFLKKLGIERITLPAELNYRELSALDTKGTELNVYGYQALMQSAQCVTKNTKGCTGKPELLHLRDRKRAEFPVLNRCNICCNTIYNSVPLQLGDCRDEIEKLQAAYVRVTFTIESAQETRRVLQQYTESLFGSRMKTGTDLEGTRGHFRRGVE